MTYTTSQLTQEQLDNLTVGADHTFSLNFTPMYNMTFHDGDGEVGKMEWGNGKLEFSGDMEESAKQLFEYLKPYVDQYIEANK